MRLIACLLVLLTSARTMAADAPMLPASRALYDQAMDHYAAHEYRDAVRALESAYALDPRPEFLFTEAQAMRLAGDCPAALVLYQRFVETKPPSQQIEATRIAVARCEAAAAVPPVIAPAPVVTLAPPSIVATPPAPPRWYRDRTAGLLVGAGLVGVGAGVALLASARSTDSDASAAMTLQDYSSRRHSAERRWAWGLGVAIAGSTMVAVGLGRYVWLAAHPQGATVNAGTRF